ncbi:MAG: hypothetical protein EBW87_02135 [Burkholderiaceae bacterium]|nr:hypothetical protein [Burkholderiaceae bacterium]
MAKKTKFVFNMGDPSDDGHGKHVEVFVKSSGTYEDIKKAFKILETKGLDFKKLCSQYEDNIIPKKQWKIMQSLGVDVRDKLAAFDINDDDAGYVDGCEYFVYLIIECLNKVNPDLEIERVQKEYTQSLGTFGYGLFW